MTRGRKPLKSVKAGSCGRPMRYPNGYGNVSLLSNPEKRRKPYIVRVPDGWKETTSKITGKRRYVYKYKILAYTETWEEGNELLVQYNSQKDNKVDKIVFSPVKTQKQISTLSFADIYEKAVTRKLIDASDDTISSYKFGYDQCKSLYNMPITDIKTIHLQKVIDDLKSEGKSTSTLRITRKVMNVVMDYAVQNDLINKQYASFLDLGKATITKNKTPFSNTEIKLLFKNDFFPYVNTVLILIYTGIRINEFLKIENKDVFLEEHYLITGSKTEAGKNRIIPLNHKIESYIKNLYNPKNKYLFSPKGYNLPLNKTTYRTAMFDVVMKKFKMDHTPHECRHTCASLLDAAGANKVAIQKILGHKGEDITEHVYTHKSIEQLLQAIEMI